jgi:hypothetical protein
MSESAFNFTLNTHEQETYWLEGEDDLQITEDEEFEFQFGLEDILSAGPVVSASDWDNFWTDFGHEVSILRGLGDGDTTSLIEYLELLAAHKAELNTAVIEILIDMLSGTTKRDEDIVFKFKLVPMSGKRGRVVTQSVKHEASRRRKIAMEVIDYYGGFEDQPVSSYNRKFAIFQASKASGLSETKIDNLMSYLRKLYNEGECLDYHSLIELKQMLEENRVAPLNPI